MNIDSLDAAHLICAGGAFACFAVYRLRHMALAVVLLFMADIAIAADASWQVQNAMAFIGPASTLVAVAFTVGAPIAWVALLASPIVALSAAAVARGQIIGAHGIAWCLVVANVYAAIVGLALLRVGARQVHRFVAGLAGLTLATSAPSAVGWTLYACGHSPRSGSILDCVFFVAIVVASIAEWTRLRRSKNLLSLHSSALSSHR